MHNILQRRLKLRFVFFLLHCVCVFFSIVFFLFNVLFVLRAGTPPSRGLSPARHCCELLLLSLLIFAIFQAFPPPFSKNFLARRPMGTGRDMRGKLCFPLIGARARRPLLFVPCPVYRSLASFWTLPHFRGGSVPPDFRDSRRKSRRTSMRRSQRFVGNSP